MDMVTLITIIAIAAAIAAIALFVRQKGSASDEDNDDAGYDEYDESDGGEDTVDDEDEYDENDEDGEADEDDEDIDEDGEAYEDDESLDENGYSDEDGDEYEVEVLPLEAHKATVVGMDIERRQKGSSKNPSSSLAFLVEYKIRQGRNNSEVITLEVPEEIYSDIKLGENDLLVVQGRRFIDFGDRYAEDADEEDIEADGQQAKSKKPKKDNKK